jgi:hypothetical protein
MQWHTHTHTHIYIYIYIYYIQPFLHSGRFLSPKGDEALVRSGGVLCLPEWIHPGIDATLVLEKLPRANRPTTRRRRTRAVQPAQMAISRRHHDMNGSKGSRGVPIRVRRTNRATNQQNSNGLPWKLEWLWPPGWLISVPVVPKASHWRRYEKPPGSR